MYRCNRTLYTINVRRKNNTPLTNCMDSFLLLAMKWFSLSLSDTIILSEYLVLKRHTVSHAECMSFYHIQYIAFSSGTRLSNFDIAVGPFNDQYWKCGSSSNDMDTGEIVSFTCDPNAIGSALNITIKNRKDFLVLCEVLVFGKGMSCSNCNQPISNLK